MKKDEIATHSNQKKLYKKIGLTAFFFILIVALWNIFIPRPLANVNINPVPNSAGNAPDLNYIFVNIDQLRDYNLSFKNNFESKADRVLFTTQYLITKSDVDICKGTNGSIGAIRVFNGLNGSTKSFILNPLGTNYTNLILGNYIMCSDINLCPICCDFDENNPVTKITNANNGTKVLNNDCATYTKNYYNNSKQSQGFDDINGFVIDSNVINTILYSARSTSVALKCFYGYDQHFNRVLMVAGAIESGQINTSSPIYVYSSRNLCPICCD